MKIDITKINQEYFVVRPVEIAGETCSLVFPKHIGCKWSADTLFYRSSIWNAAGNLISASFPKFFNMGEQEELSPPPKNLSGCQIIEKLDGSTLIVSKYKGELIVRTRGTADAYGMENAFELDILKEKYPRAFDNAWIDCRNSLIFEWLSPANRIVIKHDEPEIKLIGMIKYKDYSLLDQYMCDDYAEDIGVKRPRRYDFDSVSDMSAAVEVFEGVEGVCVYSKNGQTIHKLKASSYLIKHRLKDQLRSIDNVIDFYFVKNQPSYDEFYKAVESELDWETAEEIRGDMSNIVDGMKEVDKIIVGFNKCVDEIKDLPTRKEQAEVILHKYSQTNRAAMVFSLLDGKELSKDMLKKLLNQTLGTK